MIICESGRSGYYDNVNSGYHFTYFQTALFHAMLLTWTKQQRKFHSSWDKFLEGPSSHTTKHNVRISHTHSRKSEQVPEGQFMFFRKEKHRNLEEIRNVDSISVKDSEKGWGGVRNMTLIRLSLVATLWPLFTRPGGGHLGLFAPTRPLLGFTAGKIY